MDSKEVYDERRVEVDFKGARVRLVAWPFLLRTHAGKYQTWTDVAQFLL